MEVRVPGQLTPFVYNESGFNIKERRERLAHVNKSSRCQEKSRGATAKGVSTISQQQGNKSARTKGKEPRILSLSLSPPFSPFKLITGRIYSTIIINGRARTILFFC
jgi:hypothetical protein